MKQSMKMVSSLILYTAAACGVADEVTPYLDNKTSSSSESSENWDFNIGGFGGYGWDRYDNWSSGGLGGNGGFTGGEYNGGFGGAGEGGKATGGFSGRSEGAGGSYNNSGGFRAVGGYDGNSNEETGGFNVSSGNNIGGFEESKGGNAGATGTGSISENCIDLLGKFTTYSQGGWHKGAASLLPAILSLGEVIIGDKNKDHAVFTTPDAITNFLPATGTPGALQGQYINPTTTLAGVLGGQTLTLKLNLAISNQACGYKLDDLIITEGTCKNKSVSEVNNLADHVLSGMTVDLSYSDVNKCVEKINLNFHSGNVDNKYLKLP